MEIHKPTPEEEAFLKANSWCASRYNALGNVPFTPGCRMTKLSPLIGALKDQLFSRVMKDTAAVPVVLGFHEGRAVPEISPGDSPSQQRFLVPTASLIFDLRSGIRGFNGFAHGGFFGVLIDESVGNFLLVNSLEMQQALSKTGGGSEAEKERFVRDSGLVDFGKHWALTVGINVRLLKAMDLPTVVLARSFLDRIEGRKMWIKTVIEGEGGVVYSTGESIWLLVKGEQGKL